MLRFIKEIVHIILIGHFILCVEYILTLCYLEWLEKSLSLSAWWWLGGFIFYDGIYFLFQVQNLSTLLSDKYVFMTQFAN